MKSTTKNLALVTMQTMNIENRGITYLLYKDPKGYYAAKRKNNQYCGTPEFFQHYQEMINYIAKLGAIKNFIPHFHFFKE